MPGATFPRSTVRRQSSLFGVYDCARWDGSHPAGDFTLGVPPGVPPETGVRRRGPWVATTGSGTVGVRLGNLGSSLPVDRLWDRWCPGSDRVPRDKAEEPGSQRLVVVPTECGDSNPTKQAVVTPGPVEERAAHRVDRNNPRKDPRTPKPLRGDEGPEPPATGPPRPGQTLPQCCGPVRFDGDTGVQVDGGVSALGTSSGSRPFVCVPYINKHLSLCCRRTSVGSATRLLGEGRGSLPQGLRRPLGPATVGGPPHTPGRESVLSHGHMTRGAHSPRPRLSVFRTGCLDWSLPSGPCDTFACSGSDPPHHQPSPCPPTDLPVTFPR